jgi:hypothetical protein
MHEEDGKGTYILLPGTSTVAISADSETITEPFVDITYNLCLKIHPLVSL